MLSFHFSVFHMYLYIFEHVRLILFLQFWSFDFSIFCNSVLCNSIFCVQCFVTMIVCVRWFTFLYFTFYFLSWRCLLFPFFINTFLQFLNSRPESASHRPCFRSNTCQNIPLTNSSLFFFFADLSKPLECSFIQCVVFPRWPKSFLKVWWRLICNIIEDNDKG